MSKPTFLLLAVGACVALSARSVSESVPAERFAAHVTWLSDDARNGRQTGTPELQATAEYVVGQFEAAGLEPFGEDDGWFQTFEALGGRVLADGNELVVNGETLALGQDWMPFQTASSGEVSGPLVFVGYGITDTEGEWDDYADIDVEGAIVVALRKSPRASEVWEGSEGVFGEKRWQGLRTFGHKINNAFRRGAVAVIVVNDPANHEAGTIEDNLVRYGPMSFGGPAASLPSAHMTAKAGAEMLAATGHDIEELQAAIDHDMLANPMRLQGAEVDIKVRSEREAVSTVNVVGVLRGSDPDLEDEVVVVGAHMDHVGLGLRTGSRGGPAAQGEIHNGADDNASGTAGLIEIAHMLGRRAEAPRRSIVFVAFSGEEWGLLGSQHFVETPPRPMDPVAMINMDMIGRSTNGYVNVEGVATSPAFRDMAIAVHEEIAPDLDMNLADRPASNSDHHSFFVAEVPVIGFFTGLHDDYHMPSDDADKINAEAGAAIATMAGELAARLASTAERPAFIAPEAPSNTHGSAASSASTGSGYRVVFGTSPDMGYQKEDGVRISGVREGTPAAEAGVEPGDVIVAMDGQVVRNLQDYAVLLFAHQPGDKVVVTVRRGDEEIDLQATLTGKAGDS